MTSWTSGCLTTLQLHRMMTCAISWFLWWCVHTAWWCSVALQYLACDCLPSRIFILWENLYCTLLTAGTFSLSVATWCPTCFLTNSTISGVIRALWLWKPQTPRSAPLPFSPLLMMSWRGFPSSPQPLFSWWLSSITTLKRTLLFNHCCPALLCPQSHPYVLLLNYPS